MDKSCPPATTESSSATSNYRDGDVYLKHLNKLSHKITKPKKPTFDNIPLNNPPPLPHQNQSQPLNQSQHQPPVYNINKSDFRDVVQKLTGSPAHERLSTPPPIQQPKPTSSRLQKIRPPPLPQLNPRPSPVENYDGGGEANSGNQNSFFNRQPLSPLPPFPSVHAAAESPISAYMRYIHNSSFVSPRWSNFSQPLPPVPPPNGASSIQFPMPSSSLPLGCLPSPKSPYPSLFSPTTLGFQQFPLSPTVPKGV